MLKAAKWVKDEQLAKRLLDLAWFMIGKTLPYTTLDTPYITKGNPRFCTQYNNSETGENIGPMLSGTASWLTLALFELLGINDSEDGLSFAPLLAGGEDMAYTMQRNGVQLQVTITGKNGHFRSGADTQYVLDGAPCTARLPKLSAGEHSLSITL